MTIEMVSQRKLYSILFVATCAFLACSKQGDADKLLGSTTPSTGTGGAATAAGPLLLPSPSTKDFGNVATNSNSSQTFIITNSGSVSAVTQTLSVSGAGFSIFANTCNGTTISAGGTCTFSILFAPGALGATSGTASLAYAASSGGTSYTMSASLLGVGIAPSVAFSFLGFNLGTPAHTSSLTATGVVLNWALATAGTPAYYKITRTVAGVTTVTAAITPVATTTYTVTGLTPNTVYTYQINAFDASDVSDGNANTISFTTATVTGSTFMGWADLVATGTVTTNINAISAALYAATVVPSLSTTGAQVKLSWEQFTIAPSGTADGYNVYRSLVSGAGFALIGTSPTVTYIDTTVADSTTYYYKVHPTILGVEYTAGAVTDTEIQVFVPPTNMALVHRWITNREECTTLLGFAWPGGIDRTNNYRCAYVWGSGYAPTIPAAQKLYWDIGYSLVVDRWEIGCGMTATGPQFGAGAPAGGSNGDIYFRQGTGVAVGGPNTYCYTKNAGAWTDYSAGGTTDALRGLMSTNMPGYAPINSDQIKAYGTCTNRTAVGVGALRLPRLSEDVAMKAWTGVFNNPSTAQLAFYTSGINHAVFNSCNINAGNGLLTTNTVFFPNQYYTMITGSDATRNCKTRYDIQDPSGNMMHWTSDQFSGTAGCSTGTCVGSISALDASSRLIDGLAMDNVSSAIPCGNCGSGATAFSIPMLGVFTTAANVATGSRAVASITAAGSIGLFNESGSVGVVVGALDSTSTSGSANRISRNYMDPTTTWRYGLHGFRCVGQVGP